MCVQIVSIVNEAWYPVRNAASFYLFAVFKCKDQGYAAVHQTRNRKDTLCSQFSRDSLKLTFESMNPACFKSICLCQVGIFAERADANLLLAAISTQATRSSVWPSKCRRFRTAFWAFWDSLRRKKAIWRKGRWSTVLIFKSPLAAAADKLQSVVLFQGC